MIKKLSHCACDKLTPGHRGSPASEKSWFERLLLKFVPHFDIVKTVDGPNGTKQTVLYLRRFYFWRSKWIGKNWGDVYLHNIVRSDDDPDPHDHPWSFVTFVLRGRYLDERHLWIPPTWNLSGFRYRGRDQEMRAPDMAFRHKDHIHRVIVPEGGSAWTLIVTGPYRKTPSAGDPIWYFVTKDRKVFWREYLGVYGDHGS